MQLANRAADQSKLFPVTVLLQYARLSYPSQSAILGCFVRIRTASVRQADRTYQIHNRSARQAEGSILLGVRDHHGRWQDIPDDRRFEGDCCELERGQAGGRGRTSHWREIGRSGPRIWLIPLRCLVGWSRLNHRQNQKRFDNSRMCACACAFRLGLKAGFFFVSAF